MVHPLTGSAEDYDPLMDLIGDARFVLLGEATHGTHEFYRERAVITQRLIVEKEFNAVAVEADWPDAYRVNWFIQGKGNDRDASESLGGLRRFPNWMWRNADVLNFVGWLRNHNETAAANHLVGFYGLDLYSLYSSIRAVIDYLQKVDAEAAREARQRYSCFDQFAQDTQAYGWAATSGRAASCEREVVAQLVDLQRRASDLLRRDGRFEPDEFFYAEQNARVARNAEEYYRAMYRGRSSSWNLRDRHMAETLQELVGFLEKHGTEPKVVIWAHNSHLGDARATQMGDNGELNLGQLVREAHSAESKLVGFTTYTGTVTAASEWDGPSERKQVRPALRGSYEALFHETGVPRFMVPLSEGAPANDLLREPRLERAIGVIYRPESERYSHYFNAWLTQQFDALIHFDVTRAVEPLDRSTEWVRGETSETFPSGF
jgi:erythromycin esterase-like protein